MNYSKGWLVVGTLAVVGAFWIVVNVLITAGAAFGSVPYLGHAVGAAVAGAAMTTHSPLRPWREPLLAGVLAIAVLATLFLVLPHARFSWVAARSDHPWLVAAVLAAMSGACATAGAAVLRRLAPGTRETTASVLVLGGLVTTGVAAIAMHVPVGLGWSPASSGLIVAVLAAVFVGGAITQAMVAAYRPWACGSGIAVFGFLQLLAIHHVHDAESAIKSVVGAGIAALIGAWGARRAWRRKERLGLVAIEVPVARRVE